MPKIIKDIEDTIFEKAKELFCLKGYDKVDMKTLAEHCNIAVGTLYNYYPNKKRLYLDVVTFSWKSTFERLKEIKETKETKDYIRNIVEILYDDICNRKGLGANIRRGSEYGDKDFIEVEKYIRQGIENAFLDLPKKSPFNSYKNLDKKITVFLISMIGPLVIHCPEEREENISIICESINVYYK